MADFAVQVDGLNVTAATLRAVDADLHRGLKPLLNEAARVIANEAKTRVPRKSGRLANSIRPASTATQGRVAMGSKRVSYAGFIEFGGRVGRHNSVRRAWVPSGRYLQPSLKAKRAQIDHFAETLLQRAARRA